MQRLWHSFVTLFALGLPFSAARAQGNLGPSWDSVATVLQTSGAFAGGYYRYNFPRTDLTVRIGSVTVATGLAFGSWAGFSGEPGHATVMGDLVLTASELPPVEATLASRGFDITAVHNHLVGEEIGRASCRERV